MTTPDLHHRLWLPAGLAATLFLAGKPLAAAETPARKPNFVVILIDDMGWRDIGANGSKTYKTPNIDKLASQGMRFTQGYAACAVCSPTRAALMTGKYPARLHITDWIRGEGTPKESMFAVPKWTMQLPLEEITIAEALKPQGYATASIGKWHLGGKPFYPENQGFDLNVAGSHIGQPASYFWPYGGPKTGQRVPGLSEAGGQDGEYLTDRLTDEAVKFIGTNQNKPFFLYLPHYAVHGPLMGKPEYVKETENTPVLDEQKNHVYAAMVRSVDDSVGEIMKTLEQLQLSENTVVIFTSDNGGVIHAGKPPATSNLPLRAGKGYPYEGGIREPLIIKAPGITKPGSVCDTPVITMDFFPTLVTLAGVPELARTAIDGKDLTPLLKGAARLDRDTLCWHYPHYWAGKLITPYSIIRSGDLKLIHWYETDAWELYNLADDLSEKNDLAARQPEKVAELRAKLEAWLKETGAQLPVPREESKKEELKSKK
jgi:arylsulfatase A-like enzyme